jgi:hypothetical protein
VIISDAMTSVYMVIAVWMPATVVPTSLATVAIDTFITELSSVMRNCADANVSRIVPDAFAARSVVTVTYAPSHQPDGRRRCPAVATVPGSTRRERPVARGALPAMVAYESRHSWRGVLSRGPVNGTASSRPVRAEA